MLRAAIDLLQTLFGISNKKCIFTGSFFCSYLQFIYSLPVVIDWWAEPGSAWYRPYIIWLALIGVAIWLESRRGPNEFLI